MRMKMQLHNNLLAMLSVVIVSCFTSQAGIVYDNSTTPLGSFYQSTNEFGDQIVLDSNPGDRVITTFDFEYFLSHNASGNEQAELRIYNNSTRSDIGTLIYDSGMNSITTGDNHFEVSGLSLNVANDISWTVQFSGIDAGESAGLLWYNPPTVGSSLDDFWEKTSIGWTLKRLSPTGGPIANFGAQVTAIPEPTTIQLAVMSGMAWLGMATYRRRK